MLSLQPGLLPEHNFAVHPLPGADPGLLGLQFFISLLEVPVGLLPDQRLLYPVFDGYQQLPELHPSHGPTHLPVLHPGLSPGTQLHLSQLQCHPPLLLSLFQLAHLYLLHQWLPCKLQQDLPALLLPASFLHLLRGPKVLPVPDQLYSRCLRGLSQL